MAKVRLDSQALEAWHAYKLELFKLRDQASKAFYGRYASKADAVVEYRKVKEAFNDFLMKNSGLTQPQLSKNLAFHVANNSNRDPEDVPDLDLPTRHIVNGKEKDLSIKGFYERIIANQQPFF